MMELSGTRAGTLNHGELPGERGRCETFLINTEIVGYTPPPIEPNPAGALDPRGGLTEEFRRAAAPGEPDATVEMTWQKVNLGGKLTSPTVCHIEPCPWH